jgi:hypothetical protein
VVTRINHVFRQGGEVWCEVMVGRSDGVVFREPQVICFGDLMRTSARHLLCRYVEKHLLK